MNNDKKHKELIAELNKLKALRNNTAPYSKEFNNLTAQIKLVEALIYDVKPIVPQKFFNPKFVRWAIIVIVAIVLFIVFTSCSSTKKNKSSYRATTDTEQEQKKGIDTTASKSADLQQKKDAEKTTGSQEESEVTKILNIDFGNGTADDYAPPKKDTVVNGTKIKTTGTGTVKINTDGSIEASGNIKKASYTETGKTKKQDSSFAKKTTYTRLKIVDEKKGIDTTASKTKEKTVVVAKNKTVKRTSHWHLLWLLLIPIVWLAGWYLGLWPLLPKRKEKRPVNYSDYNPPKPPLV